MRQEKIQVCLKNSEALEKRKQHLIRKKARYARRIAKVTKKMDRIVAIIQDFVDE